MESCALKEENDLQPENLGTTRVKKKTSSWWTAEITDTDNSVIATFKVNSLSSLAERVKRKMKEK